MLGIQCYAIFWLAVSGYTFQTLMEHTGSSADEEENRHWKEEMEAMGDFFSPRYIGRMFLSMSLLLLLIDCAGFFLTYQYAQLRPWQSAVFYLVATALLLDAVIDFYRMRAILQADAPEDIAKLMSEYMDSAVKWSGISLLAMGGKCLIAVMLVLWTVFR